MRPKIDEAFAMNQAIIFDMDGTLWDSAANVAESWNEAVKKEGYDYHFTKDDIMSVMGKTMDQIGDILFSNLPVAQRRSLMEVCCAEENAYLATHGGELYPDLKETMERLKEQYDLYIVSNCQSGYIEGFLAYYHFGNLFKGHLCFGDTGLTKGANIAKLCKDQGIEQAIYVGDIQGDYDSTMEAGQRFIHAAYGFGTINGKVPKINSLPELLQVAPQVFKGDYSVE